MQGSGDEGQELHACSEADQACVRRDDRAQQSQILQRARAAPRAIRRDPHGPRRGRTVVEAVQIRVRDRQTARGQVDERRVGGDLLQERATLSWMCPAGRFSYM